MHSRREFLRMVGFGAAGMAMGGCRGVQTASEGAKSSSRPNIVFLLTDDQRYDSMGCAGNGIVKTPNLDRLAGDGVRFSNCFVTTAICCSSRASIFSGQYARRHGINDFVTDFSDEAWRRSYPALLRAAGYRTGFVGKFGVGTDMPAETFDYWRGIEGQPTYEHIDENGDYKHLTEILGDQSVEFINSGSDVRPFCLSVSFKAPHVEDADPRQFIYDRKYAELYADVTIPKPPLSDGEYFEGLPDFIKESEARIRFERRFPTAEKYQEMVKGYYRLVTGVDDVVGRIRKGLAAAGLIDNTIIIFTSDNGFYLGDRGLSGKWFGHEESIRVPLIVFDPRAARSNRGRVCEEMALNIDMGPTMLDMAGVEVPAEMQGLSLVGAVAGAGRELRDEFYYEHEFEFATITKSVGVRTKRYKYLRYYEEQPVYEMLFDLEKDAEEVRDLAREEEYAELLAEMRRRCDKLMAEAK